jgi:hypothetical protein
VLKVQTLATLRACVLDGAFDARPRAASREVCSAQAQAAATAPGSSASARAAAGTTGERRLRGLRWQSACFPAIHVQSIPHRSHITASTCAWCSFRCHLSGSLSSLETETAPGCLGGAARSWSRSRSVRVRCCIALSLVVLWEVSHVSVRSTLGHLTRVGTKSAPPAPLPSSLLPPPPV